MHTYFRTPDIANASISGLEHLTYIDKVFIIIYYYIWPINDVYW